MKYGSKPFYYILIVILFSIFFGCAHSLPAKPTASERIKLAVIPASSNEIDQKLSEMLTTALRKEGYFVLVQRNKIKKVFNEQKFQYSGIGNDKTLVKLGNLLEAQYIVVGSMTGFQREQSSSSVSIGIDTSTINVKIMDIRQTKMIALVSSKGRSFTGGLGYDAKFHNKTKKDMIGVQRSSDDMENASIRSAVDNMANDIINAVYNKQERFITAEVVPSNKIESWSKNNTENKRALALARLYLAPYDLVWMAITEYFKDDLITVDKQRGIIITKYFEPTMSVDRRQIYCFVERDSLNCTKVTVKGFCYSFKDRCPQHRIWMDWMKLKGICWIIWPNPTMCSNVYIKNLTKAIEEKMTKGGQ
jgi:curli biogenesis system outer membrane secretion channel CsgG